MFIFCVYLNVTRWKSCLWSSFIPVSVESWVMSISCQAPSSAGRSRGCRSPVTPCSRRLSRPLLLVCLLMKERQRVKRRYKRCYGSVDRVLSLSPGKRKYLFYFLWANLRLQNSFRKQILIWIMTWSWFHNDSAIFNIIISNVTRLSNLQLVWYSNVNCWLI